VLKTAQAFIAQEGCLPLNVKFLFEGEEEIGSPHLPAFVRARRRTVKPDSARSNVSGKDQPSRLTG
jgi:acetylornithine deacetylase/succinyl-diaminopimelate desuccinylase-like protein